MPFHDAALQQVIPVLRISSLEGFAGAAHRSTNSCGVLVYTKNTYLAEQTTPFLLLLARVVSLQYIFIRELIRAPMSYFHYPVAFCARRSLHHTRMTHTHIFSGALTTRSVPTHYVLQILSWSCSRIWSRALVYGTRTNIQ